MDLGRLPLSGVAPDLALDGIARADVDVRSGERGPEGRVELHAAEGSVGLPGLPVALPFQSLDAAATLGGEDAVTAGLAMGEWVPPSDVAEVVTFLASGKCRHLTGATIDVNGASYLR